MKARYELHSTPDALMPFIFHTHTMTYSNWHHNPEFLYCLKGSGKVYIDNEVVDFSAGDTIAVNPNKLHSIFSETDLVYYCLITDNGFLEQNGVFLTETEFEQHFHDAEAERLMKEIAKQFATPGKEFHALCFRKCVLEYLLHLCRNHSFPIEKKSASEKSNEAIKKAVEYIDCHFTEKLSLEDISSKVGFSKFHFARLLKDTTGYTLIEQINARRCEYAKQLLVSSDKTVLEIGTACGFENASYFSKTFKSYTGVLPSQYKKSIGK